MKRLQAGISTLADTRLLLCRGKRCAPHQEARPPQPHKKITKTGNSLFRLHHAVRKRSYPPANPRESADDIADRPSYRKVILPFLVAKMRTAKNVSSQKRNKTSSPAVTIHCFLRIGNQSSHSTHLNIKVIFFNRPKNRHLAPILLGTRHHVMQKSLKRLETKSTRAFFLVATPYECSGLSQTATQG